MDVNICHACNDRLQFSIPTPSQLDRIDYILKFLKNYRINNTNNDYENTGKNIKRIKNDNDNQEQNGDIKKEIPKEQEIDIMINELVDLFSRDSDASISKLKGFYRKFELPSFLSCIYFMKKRNIYGHAIYLAFRYLEVNSISIDHDTFDKIEESIAIKMVDYIIAKHQEFSKFTSESKSNNGYSNFFFYNK